MESKLDQISPVLSLYIPESELFDSYEDEDICPVCGEILEDGLCPFGCDEDLEDEETEDDEDFDDDLEDVGPLGQIEHDAEDS
jgi:hypothetical protein